jgi:hypothetical protein
MTEDMGDIGENRAVTPDPPARGESFLQFMQRTRRMGETPVTAEMIAGLPDSGLDDHVWLRLNSRVDLDSRDEVEALHPLGDHDDVRVALIRANPELFVG